MLFLAGLLIDGFAPNFSLLLLGRAIQGAGTGIALPLMFNIILEQVPLDRIGTMMGFGNLITGIAPALGPTFGGIIINSLGWRYVFYFLVPLILISLFLGIYGIQQKSKIVKITPDAISIALIAIFFTGMNLRLQQAERIWRRNHHFDPARYHRNYSLAQAVQPLKAANLEFCLAKKSGLLGPPVRLLAGPALLLRQRLLAA